MRKLLLLLLPLNLFGQFSHTVNVLDENNNPVDNVEVRLYRRVNSTIPGFTSQTNYNGHSYYRSTSSTTWSNAKTACENMGGHLATVSTTGENNFLYNTWPSGWIGLYQDKTGAFYSEPNGGWRWTENPVDDYVHNYDTKNYTTTLIDDVGGANTTLYNGPVRYTSGGNYIQFDGVNDYGITGNLASSFPNNQEVQSLQLLCYPQSTGVLVTELGVGNTNSGWHATVMEITSSGVLKVGFWNGTGISNINTPISMNTWHQITMTYDGNTLRGYLDGTYFGAITFDREVPHSNIGNGMYYSFGKSDNTNMGNGNYGQFRLGKFEVFNRVLTDDEIDRSWMGISYRYGKMKYTNWNSGEPNNAGGEDYIQFVGYGRWNDLPNYVNLPYVIEFDYVVTTTTWAVYDVSTTINGTKSYSFPYDPSKEYYIEIVVPTTTSTISPTDYDGVTDVILNRTSLKSYHYHQWDLNNDGDITIGDLFSLIQSVLGIQPWSNVTYLFTTSEWVSLKNNTSNQTSTIVGNTSTYTISSPTSGGITTVYLLSKGFKDQSTLNY